MGYEDRRCIPSRMEFEIDVRGSWPTDDFPTAIHDKLKRDFDSSPPSHAEPCHPVSSILVRIWPDQIGPRAVGSLWCPECGEAFCRIDWYSEGGRYGSMTYARRTDVREWSGHRPETEE
jgi:hypothetical protein